MALATMTNRSPGDSITASDWDVVRNNILLITGTALEQKVGDRVGVFTIPCWRNNYRHKH